MKRLLIFVATLTLLVAGLAVAASAQPSSPLVGHWQLQDFGGGDNSHGYVVIAPSGQYRVFDDAGSICLNNGHGFVPVSISGKGTFSGASNEILTGSTEDIVYCYTTNGRVNAGTIGELTSGGSIFLEFDFETGRIADSGGDPTGTCYWRTGTPQPDACPPD